MKKIQLNLELISQQPKRWKLLSEDGKYVGTIGYKTKRNFYLTDKWLNKEKNLESILEFEKNEVKSQLYGYLSRAEQSPKKVIDWLQKRGVSKSDRETLLEEVKEKGFLSSKRYSDFKLKKEFKKGNKPLWRVKLELKNQGIEIDEIDLKEYDEKESLINYVYKNLWKLKKDKDKFIKSLMMKGFKYSLILLVIEDIDNESI